MGKKEKFEKLLRDAGVSEYWCDKGFDPDEDYPYVDIVVPSDGYHLVCQIMELYNDYECETEDRVHCMASPYKKGSREFNHYTKGMERRVV